MFLSIFLIADIADYTDYHIALRKIAPKPINTVTYTVADEAGKNLKSVVVHGTNAVDPLKNVRHFRAKIEEKDGVFVVTTILLDLDWCERK